MRFWDRVAGLPPADQLSLVTDLTLACGHLTLAGKLHADDGGTARMLGLLAAAHRALVGALARLDPDAAPPPAPAALRTPADGLPVRWDAATAGAPAGAACAWLQIAMRAAADAARAALDDGAVADIRELLQRALGALCALRDTVGRAAD